jgi:uncharacterized lipoprotein YehR (DUF1307 family)
MMNATSNPQAAAEQARKIYRAVTTKFGHLLGLDTSVFGLDTSVSETVRAMAEKVVDQSRKDKMAGIVSERDLIKEFPRCYR